MTEGLFNQLNTIEKMVTIAGAAALVVQTGFTIYTSTRTSAIEAQVKRIQGDVADRAEHRQFDSNNALISKEVLAEIKAAQKGTADADLGSIVEQLSVISAYVEVIPSEQVRKEFRNAVRRLIEGVQAKIQLKRVASPGPLTPEVRQQQALLDDLSFALQEQQVTDDRAQRILKEENSATAASGGTGKVNWSNYDFDIFWCDGTPRARQAKALADAIAALKAEDPAARGNWRVRSLPLLTNQREGYRVRGFEVRVSSGDERPYAQSLTERANAVLQRHGYKERFTVRDSNMKTQWYLSVFVCPI